MRFASQRFAQAIRESHQASTVVTLLVDGDPAGPIEPVLAGAVTLDATAQSRGRLDIAFGDDGTLNIVPTEAASSLAPYGNELAVARGITFPDDTSELIGLGVYRIDDVTSDDTPSGLAVRVSGMDRSARIIDARFEEPYQVAAGENYADAILAVLQAAWPAIPTDFTATGRTTPTLIAAEGEDRWKFAGDMATSLGMVLYFDGDGTCVLRPATPGSTPAVYLQEGEGGVLLAASRRWTRQGTFNRVIATGENTGEAVPARGVATDLNPLSPTYYYGPFGPVPRFYVSSFIVTDEQAADAAAAILQRELGTTQQLNLGAIVDPRLEPDDVARVTRERSGIDEDHIIDQVTIPLDAQTAMTARSRATQVA